MKFLKISLCLLFVSLTSISCSSDDVPEPVSQKAVITDLTLTFTDASGEVTKYTYTDPEYRDNSYEDPAIELKSGETYQVQFNVFNYSNPDNPILKTEKIKQLKNLHFITYDFQGIAIDFSRTDGPESTHDAGDDYQLGLDTEWVAGAAAEGAASVVLHHDVVSSSDEPATGSATGGKIGVEHEFPVVITE